MRDQGPILVPLDGSELAEGAVAYAAAIAKALGERIVLFTTWEGTETELVASFPSMALEVEQKARAHFTTYLDGVRAKLGSGVQVETIVRSGEAGDEIIRAATELRARLLVIATHGRSGIGRWLYGSTASHLLQQAPVPLVVVGPHALERPRAEVALTHIMAPLDGSALGEAALPTATMLAEKTGARLSLVRVVRWAVQAYPYSLPDAYVPQVDEELEAGAKAYLRKQQDAMKGTDTQAFVVRGAIAEGLMEFIDREAVDLVIMTTHARTGLKRMALGSVADRMLQGSAPVLLLRPGE